ncbi:MAG: proteasome-activating nucleotidase, partial [Desulfurococcaceae archaeon]
VIEIPLPDKNGRVQIFKIHTRRVKLKGDIDYQHLAEITEGFSGADIRLAVIEAGYIAIRENRRYVTMSDLLRAIEKVKSKKSIRQSWSEQRGSDTLGASRYIT